MRSAVLAGGTASRFDGRPKGLERVGGERILDRVVDTLTAATGSLPLLVANDPNAAAWRRDLTVIGDAIPGQGSLGGIYTAVKAGEGPVLLVAWDMPFVPLSLLVALVRGSAPYDVFLPDSGGPRGVEPLCGVYGPACAVPIRQQLDRGERRAVDFHHRVRAGTLTRTEVEKHGDISTMFFNVNTAEDLRRAEESWVQRA